MTSRIQDMRFTICIECEENFCFNRHYFIDVRSFACGRKDVKRKGWTAEMNSQAAIASRAEQPLKVQLVAFKAEIASGRSKSCNFIGYSESLN